MARNTQRATRKNARRETMMGILAFLVVLTLAITGGIVLAVSGLFRPAIADHPLVETSADQLPIKTQPSNVEDAASVAHFLLGKTPQAIAPVHLASNTRGKKTGLSQEKLDAMKAEQAKKAAEAASNADIDDWDVDQLLQNIPEDPNIVVPQAQRVTVKRGELDPNPPLPTEWTNILRLGTDDRDGKSTGGRSDVMIILSVNTQTGEIKMSSIARDIYTELPVLRTQNKLNAAHAYGGPNLVMKTLNTLFDMNLTQYVTVNFHGLSQIIDSLGGVYIDLKEGEAKWINYNVAVSEDYEGFEKNEGRLKLPEDTVGLTRLDGLQAVGYARIRYVDNDLGRNTRQRILLETLMEMAADDASPKKLLLLANAMIPYVTTNMPVTEMVKLGTTVLRHGFTRMQEFAVPIEGSYTYGQVEGASVLNVDLKANKIALHSFLFGAYQPREK
ncbi:MAG: LCP family protein [Clostridia bacterium]